MATASRYRILADSKTKKSKGDFNESNHQGKTIQIVQI